MLIVFGGLPGVGKTTIAQKFSRQLHAVYLRIDTIEQALRNAGIEVWAEGYEAAHALAAENLLLGNLVVADCVNPLPVTRDAWVGVAAAAMTPIVELEIICSDLAEHRRRTELRAPDIAGHRLPSWVEILAHDYAAWNRPRHVIDTAGRGAAAIVAELTALTAGAVLLPIKGAV